MTLHCELIIRNYGTDREECRHNFPFVSCVELDQLGNFKVQLPMLVVCNEWVVVISGCVCLSVCLH